MSQPSAHPDTTPGNVSASTAARVSWALYDFGNSGFPTVVQTFVFAAYFTREVAADPDRGASQWGWAIGGAGVVVALLAPLLGATADRRRRRKFPLALLTAVCILATAALALVAPDISWVWPALLLVALATVAAELAVVLYNSLLPAITNPGTMGRWSGWAWACGYTGGLLCMAGAAGIIWWVGSGPERWAIRVVFPFVAVWYALFALPLFFLTPEPPARSVPLVTSVRRGWIQLTGSIRRAREHGPVWRFLIARLFYADALATLFAFSGVYAAGVFGFSEQEVIAFGIAVNVTAAAGAVGFSFVDDRIGGRQTVLIALLALTGSVTALLLVESHLAFWAIGLFAGIFVGPAQSASRSLLGRLAPQRLRGQVFGLYAFSGKATAFIGPLLVGTLTAATGNQRVGLAIIPLFTLAGIILLLTVPRDRPGSDDN